MRKNFFAMLAALGALAAGCNKDGVIAPDAPAGGFRPATAQSSPYQTAVYEYLPAPGQFVNETLTGGFDGSETDMDGACAYALDRLKGQKFVSLGAFGGYIVVGFDHSIARGPGEYDLAIRGNMHDGSNEPGVVWVMQDANLNGLPDDEWLQLRGSETGQPGVIEGYSVTYFRPDAPGKPVEWRDSEGNTGTVDYLKAYHKQDYYYPAWVSAPQYTLSGTLLPARNTFDSASGNWINAPYSWGYADNIGSDLLPDSQQWTGFRLANAMHADGTPADVAFIDFVKVQQAVQAKSGWIGENSCEVLSVADYSMLF